MTMREISSKDAVAFLLPRHYSGRKPNVSKAFGAFAETGELLAVCTFGKPASPFVCKGICGDENAKHVYELNRLCRTENCGVLSKFVSACLREVSKLDWIVVAYSDMAMMHHGYIYQACNFIYCGCSKARTDIYAGGNKHSRHYGNATYEYRVLRSAKHRYVYFATKNKRLRKKWLNALRYKQEPYPKGDNAPDYEIGYVLKPILIKQNAGQPHTEKEIQHGRADI